MSENAPATPAAQQQPPKPEASKDAELAVAWPWDSLKVGDLTIGREWTKVPAGDVAEVKAYALQAGVRIRDKAKESK